MKIFYWIVLLLSNLSVYAQSNVPDTYEYPIKQGSKEWQKIESIEQRIAVLQIPNTILSEISTEGLLETCLEFPYLTDILFADDYQKGFDALVNEFNGFQELLKRRDLINVLLKKYKNTDTDILVLRNKNSVDQGRFTFRYFVLEFLFTQDVVLKNLNPEQEKLLFTLNSKYKKMKNDYSDIFSNLNSLPTNLLYAKKIVNDPAFKFESAEQKNAILKFIKFPISIDFQIMDFITIYIETNLVKKIKE